MDLKKPIYKNLLINRGKVAILFDKKLNQLVFSDMVFFAFFGLSYDYMHLQRF
jgi:hypothetical protein